MRKVKLLSLCLVVCLLLSACGKSDVSGLGNLSMDQTEPTKKGGIGTLGEPSTEPTGDSIPEDSIPQLPDETVPTSPDDTVPPLPDNTEPQPTTPPDDTGTLQTVEYRDSYISMTVPAGWQVTVLPVRGNNGKTMLGVYVTDPADSNNQLFYIDSLEPFFANVQDKRTWLYYLDSVYEWAPVLTNGISAESVIREWASIYTINGAIPTPCAPYMRNYNWKNTIDAQFNEQSTDAATISAAMATVSIPNTASNYVLFFMNTLVRNDIGNGVPPYYTGYMNYGVCVSENQYQDYYDTMINCLGSLKRADSTSSGNSFTQGMNANSGTDLPQLKQPEF